jgi:DNA-binding beta-propeller fold protein YncE
MTIKGNEKAYVSSLRDREIVVLNLTGDNLTISDRIAVNGTPNRMILDRAHARLFVALDNSDTVAIVDTHSDTLVRDIDINQPFRASLGKTRFTGSHPNGLALSPDESVLFVTMGGTNSLAVVPIVGEGPQPIGLIPTGWYPNSVSVSGAGTHLYIVNAISPAGPNPQLWANQNYNQYVLQTRVAGLLTVPFPSAAALAALTKQALFNNGANAGDLVKRNTTMEFLNTKIKHVIYIVKENRTYDQVLGDLEKGNGDPSLTFFPEPISPNHHQLARQFVTLDNTNCSGGGER